MDSNVWLQTFSAIAQTAAALVGLFAVFVVYKIQDFSRDLKVMRENAIRVLPHISLNTQEYTPKVTDENLRVMSNQEILKIFLNLLEIQEKLPNQTIDPDFDRRKYDEYKNFSDTENKIFSKLKDGLFLGLSIIGISLLLIALTQVIIQHTCLSVTIMILCLLFLLFFLWATGKNIYDITVLQ